MNSNLLEFIPFPFSLFRISSNLSSLVSSSISYDFWPLSNCRHPYRLYSSIWIKWTYLISHSEPCLFWIVIECLPKYTKCDTLTPRTPLVSHLCKCGQWWWRFWQNGVNPTPISLNPGIFLVVPRANPLKKQSPSISPDPGKRSRLLPRIS